MESKKVILNLVILTLVLTLTNLVSAVSLYEGSVLSAGNGANISLNTYADVEILNVTSNLISFVNLYYSYLGINYYCDYVVYSTPNTQINITSLDCDVYTNTESLGYIFFGRLFDNSTIPLYIAVILSLCIISVIITYFLKIK